MSPEAFPIQRRAAIVAAAAVAATSLLAFPASAQAAPITVTSSLDDLSTGTLRSAVAAAQEGDTITFAPDVTEIALGSPIVITAGLTIEGPGSDALSITRANDSTFNQFQVTIGIGPVDRDVTFTGLSILGRGDGAGAAIYGDAGVDDLRLDDVVVADQSAESSAVSFYNLSGNVMIADSRFESNESTEQYTIGGALGLSVVAGDVTVSTTHFSQNSSVFAGGAIGAYYVLGELAVSDSTFELSRADYYGGALYVDDSVATSLTRVTMTAGSAERGGGVYSDRSGSFGLTASYLGDNYAQFGGGVYLKLPEGEVSVSATTLELNTAEQFGGAIDFDDATSAITVSDSRLLANTATSGGGIYVPTISTGGLTIARSSLLGNRASIGAAGLAVDDVDEDSAGLIVDSSTFGRNRASDDANEVSSIGLGTLDSVFHLSNSTVDDLASSNSATTVSIGALGDSAELSVLRSTIGGPGGLVLQQAGEGTFDVGSSILASLSGGPALTVGSYPSGYQVEVDHSLLSSATTGYLHDAGGTVFGVADMRLASLANNGGPTKTRMPHLDSPAYNAGDASPVGVGVDQRGTGYPRFVGRLDIGAVEVDAPYFADVTDPDYAFYEHIQWMGATRLSTGTPQPSGLPLYKPLDAVSRQAMAAFLYRNSGETFVPPAEPTFADVPTSAAFYTAIEWMAASGVSTGTPQPSGKPLYKPLDAVSRQAMALFIARFAGADLSTPPTVLSFADVPVTSSPAAAIAWMANEAIATGTAQPSGLPLYKPLDPVSRQAMAAFIYRLEHRY